MMPSFQHLKVEEKKALSVYLLDIKEDQNLKFERTISSLDEFRKLPYKITAYERFKSREGYPAIAPPWGTLSAIDLNTGEHLWKTALGVNQDMRARGALETGTENF